MPREQSKPGRLWLNDGCCVRLRPLWKDHVWAYGFTEDRTHDSRKLRRVVIVDEFTRQYLALDLAGRQLCEDVLEWLAFEFTTRGVPEHHSLGERLRVYQ